MKDAIHQCQLGLNQRSSLKFRLCDIKKDSRKKAFVIVARQLVNSQCNITDAIFWLPFQLFQWQRITNVEVIWIWTGPIDLELQFTSTSNQYRTRAIPRLNDKLPGACWPIWNSSESVSHCLYKMHILISVKVLTHTLSEKQCYLQLCGQWSVQVYALSVKLIIKSLNHYGVL